MIDTKEILEAKIVATREIIKTQEAILQQYSRQLFILKEKLKQHETKNSNTVESETVSG